MNVWTKTLRIAAALLLGITSGCSRKAEQVAPPPPEVLVTTVMQRDGTVGCEWQTPHERSNRKPSFGRQDRSEKMKGDASTPDNSPGRGLIRDPLPASDTTRLQHASELLQDLLTLCGHPHAQTKTCRRS
jgi:hypothetical protein